MKILPRIVYGTLKTADFIHTRLAAFYTDLQPNQTSTWVRITEGCLKIADCMNAGHKLWSFSWPLIRSESAAKRTSTGHHAVHSTHKLPARKRTLLVEGYRCIHSNSQINAQKPWTPNPGSPVCSLGDHVYQDTGASRIIRWRAVC